MRRELLHWFCKVCWLGVAIWAGTIFYFSSLIPVVIVDMNVFDIGDKVMHFTAFFAGALALTPALRLTWDWSWKKVWLVAAVALSLYGVTDEIHQLYTPGRSGLDFWDWVADTVGGATGTALAVAVHRLVEKWQGV